MLASNALPSPNSTIATRLVSAAIFLAFLRLTISPPRFPIFLRAGISSKANAPFPSILLGLFSKE